MLFPALGFFNVYPFRFSFVADHFQYLACIGPIALAAGAGAASGLLKGNRQVMLIMAVLLMLGVLTWKQSGMYADAETLYRTTIRGNPACWMAHTQIAKLLAQTGRADEAMAHFQQALEISPSNLGAHNRLGILLAEAGRIDEAIAHFQKVLELNPNDFNGLNNLAVAFEQKGQLTDATALFQKALPLAKSAGDKALARGISAHLEKINQLIRSVQKSP